MAKAKKQPAWDNVLQAADEMSVQDESTTLLAEQERQERAFVRLSVIQKRQVDTRPLNSTHIASLAESIAILGLLEPLVIDQNHRLLAGGHRLAAIEYLKNSNIKAYDTHFVDNAIPVRIMPFDAEEDSSRALQIEIAENEHRRDYTRNEVRKLADRLLAAGYQKSRGRPKKGDKSLLVALSFVVNKNKRTIERYLEEDKINTTNVAFISERTALQKAHKTLLTLQKSLPEQPETPKRHSLANKLPSMMSLIDAALAEVHAIESNET